VEVEEAFLTPRDTTDNVDSPTVWHGPDGQHWLLATAKEGDVIRVFDATNGEPIRRVGGSGTDLGAFERPNGIAVVDDLLLVVERDNRRVQVFSLPGFTPLGAFGQNRLRRPYGVTVFPDGDEYALYVTDAYEESDESVPPLDELDERVKQYRFSVEDGTLTHAHVRTFGDTSGPGVLKVVESIWADPEHDRLLIAEEKEGESQIKVYTLDGTFTGDTIGRAYFPNEAEGIMLYRCPGGGGYWITTDQSETSNTFHLFERSSFRYAGSFRGQTVSNTDGIFVTERSFGPFEQGALYAVHNDGNTCAFAWSAIAGALDLSACP
jgi:3-phytase